MKPATIKVYFRWVSLQPDRRQWKPSNPLLEPLDMVVCLEVPLQHEYIFNAEEIISKQLSNQSVEEPVLTPKGMRYCIDQFEAEMSDEPKKVEIDDTEEWEKIVEKEKDEWE